VNAARPLWDLKRSEPDAGAAVPVVAARTGARNNDDRCRRHDYNGATRVHGDATAVGCGAHARSAPAGSIGSFAKSDGRAREHDGGEQIFHLIFLLNLGGCALSFRMGDDKELVRQHAYTCDSSRRPNLN